MGFKALKNHIGSLAGAVVSDIAGAFQQQTDQKSAGKVSAKLLSKSPFEIPSSSAERVIKVYIDQPIPRNMYAQ